MKGVIFNLLENLIIERFGDETMEKIYDESDFSADAPPFVGPETYPDSDLFVIVGLLSQKTDIPAENLVFEFGKYMFPVLADKYPIFLKDIDDPTELLKRMNDIHELEVKKLYEDAQPPIFRIEENDSSGVTLYYSSKRKLCALLEGMLEGVATYFHRKIAYQHLECMKKGALECKIDLHFIT